MVQICIMTTIKRGYVYILFNKRNGTLYTGVTSDLKRRVYEHKNNSKHGFSNKYGIDKLGYYEIFPSIVTAIKREKEIKMGTRKMKIELIESKNIHWHDLYQLI